MDSNPTLDLKSIENLPKSGAQLSSSSPKMRIKDEANPKDKRLSEYYSKDVLKTEESEQIEVKDSNEQSEARTTVSGSHRRSSTLMNELKWESVVIFFLLLDFFTNIQEYSS